MANKYEEMLRNEWEKFSKNKPYPNIMLLGATGCGKSSLINLIFGWNLAPVNDVSRGTDDFKTYWGREHGKSVNLTDSRGYELENGISESFSSYCDSIKERLKESREKDALGKIHIIWYCISIEGRYQEYDKQVLQMLLNESELRGRVAVLLTKCDEDSEERDQFQIFYKLLKSDFGEKLPIFGVSTDPNLELDLEKLMFWSADQLDNEDLKEAFIASQTKNLKVKREAAAVRIAAYAAAAAAIGATPIPMSDAALLTPLQLAMATHIIHIYGMENIANISKAVIGNVVIQNLGKAFAGELLKLIPGIGTWVGGAINATVASLITSALGFAVSEICYDSCKKIARGEAIDVSSMFDMETIQSYTTRYMNEHSK